MKKFSRRLAVLLGAVILMLASVVVAEIKTYTGVGECVAGDLVPLDRAKDYARLRAELHAKKQAGEYIVSYTSVQNSRLTENEISVMTNSIVNIVGEVDYRRESMMWGDSPVLKFTATLRANINTDGISAYLQRQRGDENGAVSQIQSGEREITDGLNKVDTLNERYRSATTQQEKDAIRAEYSQADREVLAGQKLAEGYAFYNQGKYSEAIECYTQALELNQNYAAAYTNRGTAYQKLNDHELAIADYTKVIELNPNESWAYTIRGFAYDILNDYEHAIADYTKVIEIDPSNTDTYCDRGEAYLRLNDYKRAVADYTRAIELNPRDSYAYVKRGVAFYTMKDYESAIVDYTKAIEFNPNEASSYRLRGITYSDLRYYDRAITDYTRAMKLEPNYILDYYIRAIAYAHLKDYEYAIADYNKALELNPNFAAAYNNRGLCYEALGETAKAEADFAKARELGYTG